ncbi:cysteine/serine-rich nuclear protein 2 [Ditylenchus destructor]|uniref:Cysteine/serine-rich nuclear protein 2 n=1 Tax=Ditylenchus destructor TaxID=166010 RepID=A0AAD4R449_9BILA|nr:cysteine/serine-rich nuclear protein 2 [Ditylenchus destructor]
MSKRPLSDCSPALNSQYLSTDTTITSATNNSSSSAELLNFSNDPFISGLQPSADGDEEAEGDSHTCIKQKRRRLLLARTCNNCSSVDTGGEFLDIFAPENLNIPLHPTPSKNEPKDLFLRNYEPGLNREPLRQVSSRSTPFARSQSTVSVSSVTNVIVKRSLVSFSSFQFASCDLLSDPSEKSMLPSSFGRREGRVKCSPRVMEFKRTRRKKRKTVRFGGLVCWYFNRAQGYDTVPMIGSTSLGMEPLHFSQKEYSLVDFHNACAKENARKDAILKKAVIDLENSKMEVTLNGTLTPAANAEQEDGENTINLCEASTSSGSASQTMLFDDEFDSEDEDEADFQDSLIFLHPLGSKARRLILKNAGVQVDKSLKVEYEDITKSRLSCGCQCTNGKCLPSSCECALAGIKCQVDRPSYPCACIDDSACENPEGRQVFDALKVHTHFLQTIMRLKCAENAEDQPGPEACLSLNLEVNKSLNRDISESSGSTKTNSLDQPLPTVTTQYKPPLSQVEIPSLNSSTSSFDGVKLNLSDEPSVSQDMEQEPSSSLTNPEPLPKPESSEQFITPTKKRHIEDQATCSPYFPKCPSLLDPNTESTLIPLAALPKRPKNLCHNQSLPEEVLSSALSDTNGRGAPHWVIAAELGDGL